MEKNKKNNDKMFSVFKATLVCIIFAFIVFSLTVFLSITGFKLLKYLDVITETNFKKIAAAEYAFVFTFIGCLLSAIFVNIPIKMLKKATDAFDSISNGDYSARLDFKSPEILKLTSDKFNHMATQLESTEMMSNDFISNFSHEFKTPIASINGFAKLLKDENISKEDHDEYLDIIIQESERLSNLSNSILTLSNLEQQAIISNKKTINVSEQIRNVIGTLYHKWADRNISVIFDEDEFYTNGNREMLRQVWINLIDNAIKFSPEGGTIEIHIRKNNDNLCISVSNQGKPIKPEAKKRIFDKFYQADESHATNGNGLGLATVKQIISLHNGEVYLKKSDEISTVFEVLLQQEH